MDISNLSAQEKAQLLKILKEKETYLKYNLRESYFTDSGPHARQFYPKHTAFMAAGAKYRQRVFSAGNRVGKTKAGAFEVACHLTGEYPSWWVGKRFDRPIVSWACAVSLD